VKRFALALAALALIAGISACAATTAPVAAASRPAAASPSPSPTINYQQQYLSDVAPSNADATIFNAWLAANPDATNAALASALTPEYSALIAFGRALLQQQWPAKAQADVHTLALACEAEANDIDPADVADGSFDQSQYNSDNTAGEAAAQAVRADLDLPAVPNE
jgi:hypothetical protein